jgi:hypothetical protein
MECSREVARDYRPVFQENHFHCVHTHHRVKHVGERELLKSNMRDRDIRKFGMARWSICCD